MTIKPITIVNLRRSRDTSLRMTNNIANVAQQHTENTVQSPTSPPGGRERQTEPMPAVINVTPAPQPVHVHVALPPLQAVPAQTIRPGGTNNSEPGIKTIPPANTKSSEEAPQTIRPDNKNNSESGIVSELFPPDNTAPQAASKPTMPLYKKRGKPGRQRRYEELGANDEEPVREVILFRHQMGRHWPGMSEEMQTYYEKFYFTKPSKRKDKDDYDKHVKCWKRREQWLNPSAATEAPATCGGGSAILPYRKRGTA